MGNFPNSFLQDHVLRQFKIRSMVMGRTSTDTFQGQAFTLGGGDSTYSVNEIFLQNKVFNSAWITVISSVDDIDPNAPHNLKDNELARNYILTGGAVVWDGTKLIKRSGLNQDINGRDLDSRKFAYNNTTSAGVRSMPGITDFSITSTNRWGTIRKASIKFNVWSLDDLELMDRLYFRPGYHIIVEWGHTWGIDNTGKPVNSLAKVLKNYNLFFTRGTHPLKVSRAIKDTKKAMDLNYDGFLGLITNFSWSFRSDLGYDCSLEIVSRGSVLESLTTKSGRPSVFENNKLGEQAPDDLHKLNFMTKAMKILADVAPNKVHTNGLQGGEVNVWYKPIMDQYEDKPDYKDTINAFAEMSKKRNEKTVGKITEDDGSVTEVKFENRTYWAKNKHITITQDDEDRSPTVCYIPLLCLFHIFNKFLELSSTSSKIPRFDVERAGEFYTFDNHMTLDPLVAAIHRPPVRITELSYIFHDVPLKVIEKEFSCFNLLVTEKCVSEKLFEMLNSDGSATEVDLYTLCTGILEAMNTALGGINELDLDYDEVRNVFVLLDRAKSSDYSFRNKDKIVKNPLIVAGLKSIATELSVTTKISKSLGSMIAIASQGEDSKANVHLGEFKKWNSGLIDRFDEPPAGSITEAVNETESENNIPGGGTSSNETPGPNPCSQAGYIEQPNLTNLSDPLTQNIVDVLKARGITNEFIIVAILSNIQKESGKISKQSFDLYEDLDSYTDAGIVNTFNDQCQDGSFRITNMYLKRRQEIVNEVNRLKKIGEKNLTQEQKERLKNNINLTTGSGLYASENPDNTILTAYVKEWRRLNIGDKRKNPPTEPTLKNSFSVGGRKVNFGDEKIAHFVYGPANCKGKVLGNDTNSDAAKYAGRGLIQFTGKGGFEARYNTIKGEFPGKEYNILEDPRLLGNTEVQLAVLVAHMRDRKGWSGWNPTNQAEANLGVTNAVAGRDVRFNPNKGRVYDKLLPKVDENSKQYYSSPPPSVTQAGKFMTYEERANLTCKGT